MPDQSDRERPRNLSSEYLEVALEALEDMANPSAVFGPPPDVVDEDTFHAMAMVAGHMKRKKLARQSVLFTALAAEAYVNEYLAAKMRGQPKKDRDAVDRMSTVNKYVLGTRLATGEDRFPRNGIAAKALTDLFKLRHELVHPKPGTGGGYGDDTDGRFAPAGVARFLTVVGGLASVLVRGAYGSDRYDGPAELVWFGRELIAAHAQEATSLPPHGGQDVPSLIGRIMLYLRGDADADRSIANLGVDL